MTVVEFFQIVAAVIFGNVLFGLLVYSYWAMDKARKETGDESNAKFHVFICGAIGPLLVVWAATQFETPPAQDLSEAEKAYIAVD